MANACKKVPRMQWRIYGEGDPSEIKNTILKIVVFDMEYVLWPEVISKIGRDPDNVAVNETVAYEMI